MAVHQDETADTGNETAERNDPWVALHQFQDALHVMSQVWHSAITLEKIPDRITV
ncbi:hypothetical protein D3C79_1096450 [compost metagenome]